MAEYGPRQRGVSSRMSAAARASAGTVARASAAGAACVSASARASTAGAAAAARASAAGNQCHGRRSFLPIGIFIVSCCLVAREDPVPCRRNDFLLALSLSSLIFSPHSIFTYVEPSSMQIETGY